MRKYQADVPDKMRATADAKRVLGQSELVITDVEKFRYAGAVKAR